MIDDKYGIIRVTLTDVETWLMLCFGRFVCQSVILAKTRRPTADENNYLDLFWSKH